MIAYFDPTVLAAYRAEPDKYDVQTDFFEGEVKITTAYYESLSESTRAAAYIGVKFGFRTLAGGALALAAYLKDLVEDSEGHVSRWQGFRLLRSEWSSYEEDLRFKNWVQRYFEGNWDIDNGPAQRMPEEIGLINGLTNEAVGKSLIALEHEPQISFPSAQNSHRYEDAHLDLYRIIHDALNKDCIEALGRRINRPVNTRSSQTVAALKALLPPLGLNAEFTAPLDKVSEERRKASHRQRAPAVPLRAFEMFTVDLERCLTALTLLRRTLEHELGMDAENSLKRQEALAHLLRIEADAEPHYSINHVSRMIGKTIDKVEYGSRHHIDGVHQSEAVIFHFTDGSMMSLDTGSNASQVLDDGRAEDFHVNFHVHWVPASSRP